MGLLSEAHARSQERKQYRDAPPGACMHHCSCDCTTATKVQRTGSGQLATFGRRDTDEYLNHRLSTACLHTLLAVSVLVGVLSTDSAMAFPVAANTLHSVQNYYGKVLSTSKDLKTSACTAAGRPHPIIQDAIKQVPEEIRAKFYGCGAPLPLGIDGLRILDLGSGSGRDAFVCAKLVGESGSVIGIDMTDEQLDVARAHVDAYTATLGYAKPNLKFVKGYIENLDEAGIPDESVDIIISNCVVNLSPDKPSVLREAYRVLAPGGELYFSDVYCDRRLPTHVQEHEVSACGTGGVHIPVLVSAANHLTATPRP